MEGSLSINTFGINLGMDLPKVKKSCLKIWYKFGLSFGSLTNNCPIKSFAALLMIAFSGN